MLSVTQQAMTMMLCQIGVFASFFKYLSAFGAKSFAQDEGFTGFHSQLSVGAEGEVLCLGPLSSQLFCRSAMTNRKQSHVIF